MKTMVLDLERSAGKNLHSFQFANDAGYFQDVIKSYGAANVQKLKQVANKYDPQGIFKDIMPGGFKLPA